LAAVEPGLASGFHPKYSSTMFFAKISPKPSITPLMNGNARLMASDDRIARTRVFVDRDESKMARVAVTGLGGAESFWAEDGGRERC